MREKYLTVKELDDGFELPIPLCCGIIDKFGNITIPEKNRR